MHREQTWKKARLRREGAKGAASQRGDAVHAKEHFAKPICEPRDFPVGAGVFGEVTCAHRLRER